MTNSGPDTAASPAPDASGEARPQWRFSGRRGTPVHLRDQPRAPQLPEEIRQTVAQMGREAATPSVTGLGSAGVEQTNGALRQPRSATPASTPVVAGAVVPVERRAPRTSTPTQVSTTPLEAVPVAAAAIPSPEAAVRVSDEVADLVPPTELPSAPPLDATAPETPQIETPELETPDVQPTALDTSDDDAPSLDPPAAAGEPATAEAEQPSPATPAVAAKPKLSKAEQVKRAKARAKREREEAKQRDAAANAADTPAEAVPTVDPADSKMGGLKRKLFGRGAKQSPAVVETTPPVEADANVAPLAASASDLPPAGTPLQAAPEFDLSVEEPAAALIPPAAADAPFAFPTATPITDDAPLGAPQKFAPPEPSAAVDLPAPRPLAAIPVLP
ncbi:MAG: hypothetical protein JWN72_1631, partial [Thermoleophilia bacterium]|nr:hypothetical protein [Thermoleophilia bacterium]